MDENPLLLRTKAGGVVTLFRTEEIADWLGKFPLPRGHAATWRGFEIIAYRRQDSAIWEKC